MKSLAALQASVQTFVLGREHGADVAAAVVSSPSASAATRLEVYAHAYRARLAEILHNDFPGLRAMLDAQSFETLCRDYVEATQSHHYNVRWYGANLAAHLKTRQPWSETAALAEMAAFEWALGLSFDAADETSLCAADFEALPAERWSSLRLRLHGSLRRIDLRWNTALIRRAVDRDDTPPSLATFDTPQAWVISRQDTVVHHRLLDADEAAALDAIAGGADFAAACEALSEWHPAESVALRAASFLRQWVENKWIVGLA